MHPIWFSRGGFLPPPAKSISEHVYKHFLELMRAASCSVTFRFHFAMDVMVFKHFDGDLSFLDMEFHIRIWKSHIRIWKFHIRIWDSISGYRNSISGYGIPYPDMAPHIRIHVRIRNAISGYAIPYCLIRDPMSVCVRVEPRSALTNRMENPNASSIQPRLPACRLDSNPGPRGMMVSNEPRVAD